MKTIDELLAEKLISKDAYDVYVMFGVDNRGQDLLEFWSESIVMSNIDQGNPEVYSALSLAYNDGRRSFVRDIKSLIFDINQLMCAVTESKIENGEINDIRNKPDARNSR